MSILAALALMIAPRAQAGESPLKVFVLAGQSNMEGKGASADLPPELAQPQKNVLVYQDGAWLPLQPVKHFGPEVAFGQAMAAHLGQPVGIIKVAVGGTNLAVQWSPDAGKSLYTKLAKEVKAAREGRPIVIAGMLWMQGEADSKDEAMAGAYKSNFIHLIESARQDFGNAELPFVFGRVNPPGAKYAYADVVRKAQEAIQLPACRMVNCDDLHKHNDHLHYDDKGQLELGKRFSTAMIELLKTDNVQKK